jgi:hypothetical protein
MERTDFDIGFDLAGVLIAAFGERYLAGYDGLLLAFRPMLADPAWRALDLAAGRPVHSIQELDNPLLARQELVVCRYTPSGVSGSGVGGSNELLPALRTVLLAEERRVIAASVHRCEHFLASRRTGSGMGPSTGGRKLSSHPVVANQLAALVAGAAALKRADSVIALGTAAGREWLTEQVDAVAVNLIKLSGGRSMLAGHMVQLRTVLFVVNRIYLAGQPCSN